MKIKLSPKNKKIIYSVVAVLGLLAFLGSRIKAPIITIIEPNNNITVQTNNINIKGIVEPAQSSLSINDQTTPLDNKGNFNFKLSLQNGTNIVKIQAENGGKISEASLSINRELTEEEKAEIKKQNQAQLEAQKKAEAERIAKEQAEAEKKKEAQLEAQKKEEQENKAIQEYFEAKKKEWDNTKAGQICKKYPLWDQYDCERVANKEYWIGMSLEMLKEAMGGLPNSANPSNYGSGTQWQWCWFNVNPSCFYDTNGDGLVDSYN